MHMYLKITCKRLHSIEKGEAIDYRMHPNKSSILNKSAVSGTSASAVSNYQRQ